MAVAAIHFPNMIYIGGIRDFYHIAATRILSIVIINIIIAIFVFLQLLSFALDSWVVFLPLEILENDCNVCYNSGTSHSYSQNGHC